MSKEKFVRDKPHVSIGIIIAVFSLISGFSLGVTIYNDAKALMDGDGDSVPDNEEDRARHLLFLDATDDLLTFRTYESETSSDHELGHNLGVGHALPSSHLEIHSNLYDDVSTGIPILEFNIQYESLIEFIDLDSNGYFEPAVDVIIGETALINLVRVAFGYGVDGQPAFYSSYSTISGMFNMDFYTSGEHVLLSRQVGLLAPNELKSYLVFTNYIPITGGTNLALNLTLNSNYDLTFSSSGLAVEVSTANYREQYLWDDWAIIDGKITMVNTTVPSSPIPSDNGVIYINFGQLTNATFHSKLSWVLPYPSTFNFLDLPWSYIAMGSIAILMVSTTTHVVRKKPGRLKSGPFTTSSKSNETANNHEKRIPGTLRHRDR